MTHRIRRQILDLELPREEDAEALQRRASRLFRDKVAPALERQFDAMSEEGIYLRIDRLELDLGALPEDNWEQAYVEAVLNQIGARIKEIQYQQRATYTDAAGRQILNPSGVYWGQSGLQETGPGGKAGSFHAFDYHVRQERILLDFLNTGVMPWYAGTERLETLETGTAERLAAMAAPLRALFLRKPEAVKRLAYQFRQGFVFAVIDATAGIPGCAEAMIEALTRPALRQSEPDGVKNLKNSDSISGESISLSRRRLADLLEKWTPVLLKAPVEIPAVSTPAAWSEWMQQAAPALHRETVSEGGADLPRAKKAPEMSAAAGTNHAQTENAEPARTRLSRKPEELPAAAETKPATPAEQPVPARATDKMPLPEEDFIMVENAGLVLLAPYLPPFFKNTGLAEGGNFSGPETQQRAIHLLHFLATGTEYPEEPQLTLCKLLCAWPWEEPLEQDVDLTDAEKEEGIRLLQAVISNWEVIKNESVSSLRTNFLQRPGQLSRPEEDRSWRLRPERMSYDVLLERLPWSISVVRLPWMQEMIQVEW